MATGIPSESTYLQITRNELIQDAYIAIGILERGQQMDGDLLNEGVRALTMIVREIDVSGKWRWTITETKHVPLIGGNYVYDIDDGLPDNISELLTATYRDGSGNDRPLEILKAETFEKLRNKVQTGIPEAIYLTEDMDLSLRQLFVFPTVADAAVQSQVEGPYRCIRSHTATAKTEPVNGANWKIYWEAGGEGGLPWELGEEYTAPPQVGLLYRRPIIDFLTAEANPDFPLPWPRLLKYRLASDLGDNNGIPVEERQIMMQKAKGAFDDMYRMVKAKSTTRPKVKYY